MWKKNGKLFTPPLRSASGLVYNPTNEELTAAGYVWVVKPDPAPRPKLRAVYTKLEIRTAMRVLGIEEKLDALLQVSPTFAKDWNDAQELDLADPVLVQALAAGSISHAEIVAIRRKIQEARRA